MTDPHLLSTAAWLIEMADNPLTSGKQGHAAYRLTELMASSPMYACLPELIAELRSRTLTPAAWACPPPSAPSDAKGATSANGTRNATRAAR